MTSKTTNKFSPEVRARAVQMVLDNESEHPSRWAAVTSIAGKIGCSARGSGDIIGIGLRVCGSHGAESQSADSPSNWKFESIWAD